MREERDGDEGGKEKNIGAKERTKSEKIVFSASKVASQIEKVTSQGVSRLWRIFFFFFSSEQALFCGVWNILKTLLPSEMHS